MEISGIENDVDVDDAAENNLQLSLMNEISLILSFASNSEFRIELECNKALERFVAFQICCLNIEPFLASWSKLEQNDSSNEHNIKHVNKKLVVPITGT